MRRRRRSPFETPSLSFKANRILNVVMVVLILYGVRIWHLSCLQHEEKCEESRRPQRRVIIERPERATIVDRFGHPLSINRVHYNVAIIYSHFRSIPRTIWKKDEEGKRYKVLKRKNHIEDLCSYLATELNMDKERIEDLVYAKASIFGNVPFVIKEGISEKQYYRLKMMEKEWVGLYVEKTAQRVYPLNFIAADVIGYMGAISRSEYDNITKELKLLRAVIQNYQEGEREDIKYPPGYHSIEEIEFKLKELEARAYTINDYVGKAGIEGYFDATLRGFRGKKTYIADMKGHILDLLPGSQDPIPGQGLALTISTELQAYAEQLLAENERNLNSMRGKEKGPMVPDKQPWIKGGAIVVIEPKSGQILSLASYPRFNPNDFIRSGDPDENAQKQSNIHKWLESERHIEEIWDWKRPLERERFNPATGSYYDEKEYLTWENYLDLILPKSSSVRAALAQASTIKTALYIQHCLMELKEIFNEKEIGFSKIIEALYSSGTDVPQGIPLTSSEKKYLNQKIVESSQSIEAIKNALYPYFSYLHLNSEKLLFSDLIRVAISHENFNSLLIETIGDESLSNYRALEGRLVTIRAALKTIVKEIFRRTDFKLWKDECFKSYLQVKRQEEEEKKLYPKPYIEYLDIEESRQFDEFWKFNKSALLIAFLVGEIPIEFQSALGDYLEPLKLWHQEISQNAHSNLPWTVHFLELSQELKNYENNLLIDYLNTFRSFQDRSEPLFGRYSGIRDENHISSEKHLAAAFYPLHGYGYSRSQAFRQSTTIGSIFKLVTAYEGLMQHFWKLKESHEAVNELNPFVMIDDKQYLRSKNSWSVGYFLDGKSIPMFYKGGRLPRSDHAGIGRVDVVHALETSSNPYFAIMAGDYLNDPDDLANSAKTFSYGQKTGIELTGEIKGIVPEDISYNKTGLYALSIGQHSLVGTPLQTAVMLSAIANGGKLIKPQIIHQARGSSEFNAIESYTSKELYPYQELLAKSGLNFPLYLSKASLPDAKNVYEVPVEVVREIIMPKEVRRQLLEGLYYAVNGPKGTARSIRSFARSIEDPSERRDFLEVCDQIIGKTSTAEAMERISLDPQHGRMMFKHVGFAAISFKPSSLQNKKTLGINDLESADPELVVIVYLRFGDYGKEAAPLAAQMVRKWRSIQEKINVNN